MNFGSGACGYIEEVFELWNCSPATAFCDVRRNRIGRFSYLISQCHILFPGKILVMR